MSGLNVSDEIRLLLLERVYQGRITRVVGFYFDDGQRVWYGAVQTALATLVEVGRLELTYPQRDSTQISGFTVAQRTERVSLTEWGLAEYQELCKLAAQGVGE